MAQAGLGIGGDNNSSGGGGGHYDIISKQAEQ